MVCLKKENVPSERERKIVKGEKKENEIKCKTIVTTIEKRETHVKQEEKVNFHSQRFHGVSMKCIQFCALILTILIVYKL